MTSTRADRVADAVDRDEVDVLVDVDAGLGWMTTAPGAATTLSTSDCGPDTVTVLRVDVRVADGQPVGGTALLDLDGDGPLGERVELDVHERRVVAEDLDPGVGELDVDRTLDDLAVRARCR